MSPFKSGTEKVTVNDVPDLSTSSTEDIEQRAVKIIDLQLEKKLVRKIDLKMSILVLIYMLNHLDRNNIAAARLNGLEEDLGLHGSQYQTVLSMLYIGYILFQIPSNILLNKMGNPAYYLGISMSLWGTISALTGIVKTFHGALLCRFFIGFVESTYFPGAIFFLSKWYKKNEIALRTAIFFLGSVLSNALNGLLASGILSGMDGVLGHKGRWLFFIEGSITIAVALVAVLILPDFPENTNNWLTAEEKALAIERLVQESGKDVDNEKDSVFNGFRQAMSDYKTWLLAFYLSAISIGMGFNQLFPTITETLGFKDAKVTLLLVAPPWIFAAFVSGIACWSSDKQNEKYFHSMIFLCLGVIGFIISICATDRGPTYLALFLMCSSHASSVLGVSWVVTVIPRPPAKRAVAVAFVNTMSNACTIAVPFMYPNSWGPKYELSFIITSSAYGLSIILGTVLRIILSRLNKRIENNILQSSMESVGTQKLSVKGLNEFEEEAARNGWRYTL